MPQAAAKSASPPCDMELVTEVANGDKRALSALFDRFHLDVYRFLARYAGRNSADIDDLVQQTFIEVARSAANFRRDSQVKTWMFGIATNVARRWLRQEARSERLKSDVASQHAIAVVAAPAERGSKLRSAIAALPEELRVTFIMCAIEEVSGADAAAVLGIPIGTVWRRMHDARKALSAALTGSPP